MSIEEIGQNRQRKKLEEEEKENENDLGMKSGGG
jgi:hypothetical protein